MVEKSKFFEAFKKQQKSERYIEKKTSSKQFFFALFTDDKGLYVKTVNKALKNKKVNSDFFTGNLKSVIDLYNEKQVETKLIIDWSNPYSHIYLDKYPDLLRSLLTVDNLVDSKGRAIYSGKKSYPLTVNITGKNDVLECSVTLCENRVDRVISENYCLVGNRILSILPVGNMYKSLVELNTNIVKSELEKYLSIVYSNFQNIKLNYLGYSTIRCGECELLPSLIIDSIDSSGFMELKVSFSYKDYISPEFYKNYKPSIMAVLDNDRNKVKLFELSLPDFDILDKIIQVLFYIEEKYKLNDSFNIEEEGVLINPQLASLLFTSELKIILDNFSVFGESALKKYRMKKVAMNLELLLTSSIDYLQGSGLLNVSGEKIPVFEGLSYLDEKGYIPLKDGSKGIVNRSYIDKIKKVIRESKEGTQISFFDIPYIEDELEAKISGSTFIDKVKRYRNLSKNCIDSEIDLGEFQGELRPYQATGVKWMLQLHKIGISGCLADDMGLGKTVQAIAFILQIFNYSNNKPFLIVLPKSLLFNWYKEINKFAPKLEVYQYYGNERDISKVKSSTITLTTYHTLRNDIEDLKEIDFYYTILDEIQNIKNHTSQIAKSTYLIKSEYKLGISGTPVENHLGDLYSISRFLNPTLFGSFKRFKDEWSGPIASEESAIVTNILKSRIKPLFLRRIKEDVLQDLPAKTEQTIYIDMTKEQAAYYEKVRKDYHDKIRLKIRDEGIDKSQLTIIKAFMELRQIATIPEHKSNGLLNSPKKDVLLEQLLETIECGHKVLVFSNFLYAIQDLSESLMQEGVGHRVITGATNKREKVVEEFMDDPEVKVMIMTLKTGGIGLNLTAASYVYIMDPWWNLASENQAIDRIHRIGQKSSVFCYRFIARGSIEEKILELQDKKRTLFENLFAINKESKSSFDKEDIDYLLG